MINADDFEWPGDPAPPDWRELEWHEAQDDEVQLGKACQLWSGEVILNSGRGASGPFFVEVQAARAWAFSTALNIPERDIFGLQIVPYLCVRHFAPNLITLGEAEFKRLSKFWMWQVKAGGQVESFGLPGREL